MSEFRWDNNKRKKSIICNISFITQIFIYYLKLINYFIHDLLKFIFFILFL